MLCDSVTDGPIAVAVIFTVATLPPGVYALNDSELNVPGMDGVNCTLNSSCDFCFKYPPWLPFPVHLKT